MDGTSLDVKQNDIETLRKLFPHVFSEDKLDLEKFKAAFHDDIDFTNERYTLNWAGKSDAFKILQEGTTATLKPQPELSVNFDTSENVFIEGENLEVLKILQKSYYNKIKCIIIDPPYNTGSDSFIYPDRFKENLEDYEKRVGERDEEGYLMKEGLFRKNSRENGHYHSNWLNMMLPRLFLARNLLLDDGVIFVHIDDNEVHNLRLLMNEIFGEENFVGNVTWEKRTKCQNTKTAKELLQSKTEYILVYKKAIDKMYFKLEKVADKEYNLEDDNGRYREKVIEEMSALGMRGRSTMQFEILGIKPKENYQWKIGEEQVKLFQNRNDLFVKDGKVYCKMRPEDENNEVFKPFWSHFFDKDAYGTAEIGKSELTDLIGIAASDFETVKPIALIKNLINHIKRIETNDFIILDFFAGSGTTAHAVLDLNKEDNGNRKFILVQLPELCDKESEAYKAGYKTIADISRERIRRVIQKIGNGGFKAYKLSSSNFKIWRSEEITEENLEKQMEMFIDPVKPESVVENMLIELMLKSGYQLTDNIENKGDFYFINNELIIALNKMDLEIATKIIVLQPQKVITLDRLFAGNDELKTNTALQMRDAGVELRVV
jgi:adenine-specific DNA-methyltransferase